VSAPREIRAGQYWRFVFADGRSERSYVTGPDTEEADGPHNIVQLVNVETGGVGWVTQHWMRRPEGERRGWFVHEDA
jgi:hypothetical protein